MSVYDPKAGALPTALHSDRGIKVCVWIRSSYDACRGKGGRGGTACVLFAERAGRGYGDIIAVWVRRGCDDIFAAEMSAFVRISAYVV